MLVEITTRRINRMLYMTLMLVAMERFSAFFRKTANVVRLTSAKNAATSR
jgi:hypothetical protein